MATKKKKITKAKRVKAAKKVVIDYAQAEQLASENLNDKEIAESLKISYDSFTRKKLTDLRLKAALDSGRRYQKIVFCGRPSDYKPEYAQMMIEYFDVPPYKTVGKNKITVPNDLPLLSGFAFKIGVHRETLQVWSEKHEEFGHAYKLCKEIQDRNLITNGLRGLYSTFANLVSKNLLDFKDKTDLTSKGQEIKSATVYVVPEFKEEEEETE